MLPIHKALSLARFDVVHLILEASPTLIFYPFRDIPITHLSLSLAGILVENKRVGFESFRQQCAECLMALINIGANINYVDRIGRSVLHIAAYHNMTTLAVQLLSRQINQLARDYNNMLALHVAIQRDNTEVLDVLVILFFE